MRSMLVLWARDMGPQFSRSLITGKLAIVDWGFNQSDPHIPLRIAYFQLMLYHSIICISCC